MTSSGRGSPAPDVTAVIAAHDESANIVECIASLRWAREVIVVENDSTDDTIALARGAGATVISPPFTTIGAARNNAIDKATSAWILVVDADERCTPELAAEIDAVTARAENRVTAYRVKRRNFFLGREIGHGGWSGEDDHPIRLFRREHRYNASQVHEHVEISGATGQLNGSLLHYTYTSLDQYFEKFERYSRWWADQNYKKGRRGTAAAVFFKPPARFFRMYFLKGGWRDGAHGLILACLAAASVMAKYARLWERSIRAEQPKSKQP